MNLRALVVDDEALARQSVCRFLKDHPDVQVVAECSDGRSAVEAIVREKPDLVFLDIQMPEIGGFEVVSRIGVAQMPAVVFVTAYDQYALRAFDANAIDYLLKPFGKARFDRALKRARERIRGTLNHEATQQVLQMMLAMRTETFSDRISVFENGRILFVKAQEIQWIEGAGNYARLHMAGHTHLIRETLTSLETKLNPKEFIRIHRSAIVNLQFVREVQPWFHGHHLVLLENGQKLRMSRYQREVGERLGLITRGHKAPTQ